MSHILHGIVAVIFVLCVVFFFLFLPFYAQEAADCNPEFAWARIPCLIWAWTFSLPVFIALIPVWQIFSTVSEKGKAFCIENAKRFRFLATLAWIDAAVFPVGMLCISFMGAGSAPLTLVITPLVILVCLVIGFLCYVMSRLVKESSEISEDNALTI